MTYERKQQSRLTGRINKSVYNISPPSLVKSRWMQVILLGIKVIALVLFYYTFSISLTFYNKWLFQDFRYPLTITIIHLAVKFVLALIVRSLLRACTSIKPVSLNWTTYLKMVTPTGLTSALDIGFSNWSLVFITISLYTMCKSSAIIFILIFAIVFGLQKPHWMQVIIVVLIAVGLFMFTYESTQFNLEGFILVLAASVLSGLRWSLAQILTQKQETGLHNPIDIIYHLQPVMIIGLLPLAVGAEGVKLCTTEAFLGFSDIQVLIGTCAKLLLGACLAFMLAMSEYLLLRQTSTLTLSISGIFKEICTLYIASKKGDEMSLVNFLGMIVCLSGISLHVGLKAIETKSSSKMSPNDINGDMENLLNDDGSSDEDELFVRKRIDTQL
ncbi:solute carrier family 35 member C2-like isoform X1 [Lytechinus pictus]|uniref:solute carrier family 35 member C2-like isoform X1 n=1 Tax=Lytechinus pictus TaxID=7653 RepID=UPI0030B9EB2B